jgi:flagellar motor switch protein FliN/FliY
MTDQATLAALDALAQAVTAAIRQTIGADAAPVEPVEAVDPVILATGVAARSMITGGAVPGGLVTVLPAAELPEGTDPASLIDSLSVGVAAAFSQLTGTALQAEPAQPLPPGPDVAGMAAVVLRTSVMAGAVPLPIHWVVEASLAALLGGGDPVSPSPEQPASAAPAALPELDAGASPGVARDLQLLAEVPMNVTVELGRATMLVRDLLSLREGSVVELDRAAGSTVDVLVNGTLVARGEVVVLDDELGVRITEVVERT